MGRLRRQPPNSGSGAWPNEPSTDPVVDGVRRIALNLREAIGDRSIRSVAAEAGIDDTIVGDLLGGKSWPEVATVMRLELALGVELWPRRAQ